MNSFVAVHYCLLLVLVGAISSGLAEDTAARKEKEVQAKGENKLELKYEDWAPIHYEAYATEGHYRQPDDVLKLLKQLQKIYEPYSDEQTNGRKEKVNSLIQAADMNPRLCYREYMKTFFELKKYLSPYRRTMVPYLNHHFVEFMDVCEDYVIHNLHTNVHLMNEEYRHDMEEMARTVAEMEINGIVLGYSNLGKVWIYFEHLVEGILSFMEHKFGAKLDAETFIKPRDGKKKFTELFETHISSMCHAWTEATDPTEALKDYDIFLKFKEDEALWMIYGRMCSYIHREQKRILPKVYRQFKRHMSKFPKFRVAVHKTFKGFNCFDPTTH